jgi:hypothetical protein
MSLCNFRCFVLLTGLAACSTDGDKLAQVAGPNANTEGGNSGAEGSRLPCTESSTDLASLESVSTEVGVSGAELLALANHQREIALEWPARDSGPRFDTSATRLELEVTPRGLPREYVCTDPSYSGEYRPKPHLDLPVTVTLKTANGVLDERFEVVLTAHDREHAEMRDEEGRTSIERKPEEVVGSLGAAVVAYYAHAQVFRNLIFTLSFTPEGAFGWVGGPFSPHTARPCAYTEYVVWPAGSACGPQGTVEDRGAMEPHLARINRSFDLRYADGQQTKVKFEVTLADGPTCAAYTAVRHRVQLHLTSSDGRLDLSMPGWLAGGPSVIDPWPAHLADVEPFYLSLNGSVALPATALPQVGIERSDVAAAIVDLYIASPVAVDSPVLSGMLRVFAIDRTGFEQPLPTVELPGGDSAHCFSARGGTAPILQAEIEQR